MAAAGGDGQPDAEGRQRQDLRSRTLSAGRPCFRRDDGEIELMSSPKSLSCAGAGMITIRAAKTTQDIEECFRIREEVFVAEQRVPVDMERDEHDSKALHFIALADGQSVGAARVVLKDNGTSAKIGRVAVRRSNRGFGIGKLLIAAIEEAADPRRVHNFLLDAQTHALQFYARLGYEAYGEEFMDAGIPHRHMKKRNRHPVDHD
jgi:predicted GNAT family N-acyltransferase